MTEFTLCEQVHSIELHLKKTAISLAKGIQAGMEVVHSSILNQEEIPEILAVFESRVLPLTQRFFECGFYPRFEEHDYLYLHRYLQSREARHDRLELLSSVVVCQFENPAVHLVWTLKEYSDILFNIETSCILRERQYKNAGVTTGDEFREWVIQRVSGICICLKIFGCCSRRLEDFMTLCENTRDFSLLAEQIVSLVNDLKQNV